MQRLFVFFLFAIFCLSALTVSAVPAKFSNRTSALASAVTEKSGISAKSKVVSLFGYRVPESDDDDGTIDLSNPDVIKRIKIINLGPIINHPGLDYAPTISADGKTLYYVSDKKGSMLKKNGDPSHDFWVAKKQNNLDTVFFPPINIDTVHPYGNDASVNTPRNEGVASIAADRQTLVFTGCVRPDGLGDCDLYITEVVGETWSKPVNLGNKVNSTFFDSQPSISSDKSRIYFASNRPLDPKETDQGDFNIWYTDFDDETNTWKPAKPLADLNTGGKDCSPFIFPDNTTLFFSSDKHSPNMGGLDFYYSKKGVGADGKETWSKPVHIPAPVNTSGDDQFLSIPASGDVWYFSSTRSDIRGSQGGLDVFMAFVPSFFKAAQLAVSVVDECSGSNIPATVTIVNKLTGKTVKDSVTFNKKAHEVVFGNQDFTNPANPKDTIKFVDMEITVSSAKYGSRTVTKRINKPIITRNQKEAEQSDLYSETIKLGQRPSIVAEVGVSEYAKQNPNDPAIQGFRGLVMRQVASVNLYPLLNYIFFDLGSSTIPSRYIMFKSPEETKGFSDEKIPGGVFEKYYHVMNIFGHRLRKNPNVNIRVVGCNDGKTKEEKTADLSKNRATQVYNYLRDIWQIPESRMKLEFRDQPERVSNLNDSLGIVENRRTEIICEEWEVIKPILEKDPKTFPMPEDMDFTLKNGIEEQLVAKRRVVITRGDKEWATLTNVGTSQATAKWDWANTKGEFPDCNSRIGDAKGKVTDLVPYKAKLIVTSTTGQECESMPITIPVKFVSTTGLAAGSDATVEKTIEKYNLILFPFASANAGPRNERILNDYVYNRCFPSSEVEIEGHTDVVGMDVANLKLSKERAKVVEDGIKGKTKGVSSMKSAGVGEESPLYDNSLPEGRFYNRTVQIMIRTPLKDAQLDLSAGSCGE